MAFNLAYTFPACGFLIAVYLWCLFQLTKLSTSRKVSYYGLAAGLLAFAPQLGFFWSIFGPGAIALWFVCAFWIRMFLVLGWSCRRHFGKPWAVLLIPFIWTGFEFFRSELYYLRFSWLNAGYVFADDLRWLPMKLLGVYGFGFAIMAFISVAEFFSSKSKTYYPNGSSPKAAAVPRDAGGHGQAGSLSYFLGKPLSRGLALTLALGLLAVLNNLPSHGPIRNAGASTTVQVAGVQMEFPTDDEILVNLKALVRAHPEAQVLVLSEYTLDGPVPARVKKWCHDNG